MSHFDEVKDLLEEQGEAWQEFKKTNGARLDAIEADLTRLNRPQAASDGAAVVARDPEAWRDMSTGKEIKSIGIEHAGRISRVLGTQERKGTIGDFLRGVAGMKTSLEAKASIAEGSDSTGGFAVPNFLFGDFLEALVPASSVLQAGARVLPLRDNAKSYRIAKMASVPTAAWRSEAGAVAESDPVFAAVDLVPRSLAFHFKASREVLADGANIDAMLRRAIAQAFAKEIDRTALRGSGTPPEPTGVLNAGGVGSVTNGGAGATLSTIKWSNLHSAYQTIIGSDAPPPTAALMSPRSLVGFSSLADTTGQPLARPFLLEPLRFIATSQIPNDLVVGGSNDCTEIYVGDFRELIIGIREDVTVMVADQLFATTGQVAFIAHMRVDIALTHPAAFVKITGVRAN